MGMDTLTSAERLYCKNMLKKVVFFLCPWPLEEARHRQWPWQPNSKEATHGRLPPSFPPAWEPAIVMHSVQVKSWHTGATSQMFEFC